MAVYTKLNQSKIEDILSNYSLGKLQTFKGIEEGIENTNYFLSVNNKKFILTIYEKRVKSTDLPFFSDLMSSLNKASFKCPVNVWLFCKSITHTCKEQVVVFNSKGVYKDIIS